MPTSPSSLSRRALLPSAFVALALLLGMPLPGRAGQLGELVASRQAEGSAPQSLTPFRALGSLRDSSGAALERKAAGAAAAELRDGTLLALRPALLKSLRAASPGSLRLALPYGSQVLDLDLVRVDLFAPGFAVIDERGRRLAADLGVHYQGVVAGEARSFVAVSVYADEVTGLVSRPGDGNVTFGRLESAEAAGPVEKREDLYLAYADRDRLVVPTWKCALDGTGSEARLPAELTAPRLGPEPEAPFLRQKSTAPVGISVDAARSLYLAKKGPKGTTKYVTTLFNLAKALYAGEQIPIVLSELVINTKRDPYTNSSGDNLGRYQALRSTKFKGQLAQLIAFGGSGGIAAGFSGLCNSNRASSMCASQLGQATASLPNWSYPVEVFAHELGHLFGSRHTHACVWNGNRTAIDGCARFVEGNCELPSVPEAEGTIMSYCRNFSFENGFGPQPGDVIRQRYQASSCF